MSGARFFGERKPVWAIDTGDGQLVGLGYPLVYPAVKTALWRTRKDAAVARRNLNIDGARIVKVLVKYEVVS